jgi:D-arabinose 1-dehydrogenase-like Zn-dependent alcohol dehydrogenase
LQLTETDGVNDQLRLLISTVSVKLDWDAMIGTSLAPNGWLHVVGAGLEPIPVAAFSLIAQQRNVWGLADRLAHGDRDDARFCFTAQCRAADRALSDEQY